MLFFINSSFNKKNSGIEHAQLKRADLFRKNKEPFKLVFREWAPQIHRFLGDVGVANDEILNMFDYFQESEQVEEKILNYKDIDFGVSDLTYTKDEEGKFYSVMSGPSFVGRIRYYADDEKERVSTTELFDGFGNLYRVDFYDFRGFLSLAQWYTPDNKIGSEAWYTPNGRPALETYNKFDGNKNFIKTGWRLTEKSGATYMFSSIEELTLHFYNCLNEDYWNPERLNIFIMDRSHLADWHLTKLERPAYTVMHLHNSHAGDARDTMHSVMNNFYEYGLVNMNAYDATISATQKQTNEVQARFNPQSKLFTIPVGIVTDDVINAEALPMSERDPHSVLMTCRVAPEKRVHYVLESVALARQTVPDITLDVYGYVDLRNNNEAMTKINQVLDKYELREQDVLRLHDYAEDVASVQRKAQVYGLSSVMEGFNLALMEAQSQGCVGLTNDVNYGPNELVVDGENGYVLPFESIQEMADKLVELFTDDEKLQAMSDKAYELSNRYSEATVWEAWKSLLDDAYNKEINYFEPISSGIADETLKK